MRIPVVVAILAMSCALAQAETSPAKTYAREPDGKGAPAAITCRHPQALPGRRVLGPEVCRTNADWAQFAKQGMTVSADGTALVPGEKYRSLNPAACGPAAPSAPTTNAMGASSGARLC
jgi:hypothetical protein